MTMEEMITKKGIEEVIKKTVDGMIPRNRLRAPRMKNLVVTA
jgi:ribosomal protein L13